MGALPSFFRRENSTGVTFLGFRLSEGGRDGEGERERGGKNLGKKLTRIY